MGQSMGSNASTPAMQVPFEECKRELLDKANSQGKAAYNEWRQRPKGQEVVQFVEHFTHRQLFRLTSEYLREVMKASNHPLGNIQNEESLGFIEDFTCPFALQHIFHGYIEEKAAVPTWQEFEDYINTEARDKWLSLVRDSLGDSPAVKSMAEKFGRAQAWEAIKRAIQWRLGKFYLSSMRELDLLTRLRELGVPLKYHVLADVLLRVDFWTDTALVCVYFENPKYRDRKRPTERFFTGFDIIHAKIKRQGFGNFWLAMDEAVRELAAKLLRGSSDQAANPGSL